MQNQKKKKELYIQSYYIHSINTVAIAVEAHILITRC
jgi:hypothetical protein